MNKLFLWIAAASAFVLQSCENTDGIRDEIGSLRDRVIALEAKIGSVNTSIVALHKLMDESTIIVGIEQTQRKGVRDRVERRNPAARHPR